MLFRLRCDTQIQALRIRGAEAGLAVCPNGDTVPLAVEGDFRSECFLLELGERGVLPERLQGVNAINVSVYRSADYTRGDLDQLIKIQT